MTKNCFGLAVQNDRFVAEWKEFAYRLLNNFQLDSNLSLNKSPIYQAKLLYLKRRFVIEQTFALLSKDPAYQNQLELLTKALVNISNDNFINEGN